ncbi:MAG: PDDEXK nuclease domain-containing protein [Brumimicrobium sp.]
MKLTNHDAYIKEIKQILVQARKKAYSAVNTAMVEAYWLIGKRIVEEEQNGKDRATYGAQILKTLSVELKQEFGKGFSLTNLKSFRKFYLVFSDLEKGQTPTDQLENKKGQTLSAKLSWSHYERLIRVENEQARNYYIKEAAEENWSVRTLDRNISTLYYQRLISSQKKEKVEEEMEQKTADLKHNPDDFIKNPAVLDFLNLPSNKAYNEQELEQALIDNLQQFLLEMGKGFSFVARQKHIRTETADFFIDLVFYNYILKCFVIVELKTNKLTHQDIGQLDMYVRMFDDLERPEGDNPTIGILLCTETDNTMVKYSILKESKQLFANKYLPFLPSEEELAREIEREKANFKAEKNA